MLASVSAPPDGARVFDDFDHRLEREDGAFAPQSDELLEVAEAAQDVGDLTNESTDTADTIHTHDAFYTRETANRTTEQHLRRNMA